MYYLWESSFVFKLAMATMSDFKNFGQKNKLTIWNTNRSRVLFFLSDHCKRKDMFTKIYYPKPALEIQFYRYDVSHDVQEIEQEIRCN